MVPQLTEQLIAELKGFMAKLASVVKAELEQGQGTKEAKILRAAEKLHRLYAKELDKRQRLELFGFAEAAGAIDLIEVLLVLGFDNNSTVPVLKLASDPHVVTLLIKKYGRKPHYYDDDRGSDTFDMAGFLRNKVDDEDRHYNLFLLNLMDANKIDSIEFFLLNQHTQYMDYLGSFFHAIFQEEFKQLPLSIVQGLSLEISNYLRFGSALQEKLLIVEGQIEVRNQLLKPLIDYCNSHFLDFDARQVLNNLLAQKRILNTDIERELDSLLEDKAHWSKPYISFLLLSRMNTKKATHNEMTKEIMPKAIINLQDNNKAIKTNYLLEYQSYFNLYQKNQRFLKLNDCYVTSCISLRTKTDVMTIVAIAASIVVLTSPCWAPFLAPGVFISVSEYLAGFAVSLLFLALGLSINPWDPHEFVTVMGPASSLLPCSRIPALEKNNESSLEKLKENYEAIQLVSENLKKPYKSAQLSHENFQQYLPKRETKNNLCLKILCAFAGVSVLALALGIVGMCLSSSVISIGLTFGASLSTYITGLGLFRQAQYRLSKPATWVVPDVGAIPAVSQ